MYSDVREDMVCYSEYVHLEYPYTHVVYVPLVPEYRQRLGHSLSVTGDKFWMRTLCPCTLILFPCCDSCSHRSGELTDWGGAGLLGTCWGEFTLKPCHNVGALTSVLCYIPKITSLLGFFFFRIFYPSYLFSETIRTTFNLFTLFLNSPLLLRYYQQTEKVH